MATLRFHDVRDATAFVAAIAAKSSLRLGYHDAEDLRQYLLVELWKLSERYEPRGVSFSTVAGATLRKRVVDWQRQRFGRTRWAFADHVHERQQPELVSLDDPDRDHLGAAVAAGPSDHEADSDAALVGLLEERDRERLEDLATLGLRTPRGIAW
jgi:RNA polymerase sigma factor (sigma-70 family)